MNRVSVIIILLLAAGIFAIFPNHTQNFAPNKTLQASNTIQIHLVGSVSGWNASSPHVNPTITVTQGDSVTISLSSGDGIIHQFLLDMDKDSASDVADCGTTDQCSSQFSSSPTSITFTAGAAGSYMYYCTIHPTSMFGNFVIQAPPTPSFSLSVSPASVSGTTNTPAYSTITLTRTGGFDADVVLTATISPTSGLDCAPTPGDIAVTASSQTSLLACTSAAGGDFTVTVTGTGGGVTQSAPPVTFHIVPPNLGFTLTPTPTSVTCTEGGMQTVQISVSDTEGFNGMVNLSSSVDKSSGLGAQLSPTSVTGNGASTLTLTCTTANHYQVTVTGTSGSLTPVSVTIPVTVTASNANFNLNAVPNNLQCANTDLSNQTSTISLTNQNGFTGNVNLLVNISPSGLPTPSLSTHSISGSQTSILRVKCTGATPGTYTIQVQGTSGSISHTVPVTVSVLSGQQSGSFTITASPQTIMVLQSCKNMSTITLTSNNGFSGNVTLTTKISPASSTLNAKLSSVTVHLSPNQSQHIILTVSPDQNTIVGGYTVMVTAASGSTSNSTTIHVDVVKNNCILQEAHESCSAREDDDEVDHSDQNGVPCHNSHNEGAIHGIGNCANEDRDDHEHTHCGCPTSSISNEQEKDRHHHQESNDKEDHNGDENCHASCTQGKSVNDHDERSAHENTSLVCLKNSFDDDRSEPSEAHMMSRNIDD